MTSLELLETLNLNIKNLILFFVNLFVFTLIIDPSNKMLGLKTPLFLILLALLLITIAKEPLRKNTLYLFGLALLPLLIVLLSFFIGKLRGEQTSMEYIVGQLKALSVLILLPLFYNKNITISKSINKIALLVALISIISYLSVVFRWNIWTDIYNLLVKKYENGIFSFNRVFLGFSFHSMFYKTSPLVIFSLGYYSYCFKKEKSFKFFALSTLCLLGLLATGTRASMLAGCILYSLMLFPIAKILFGKFIKPLLFSAVFIISIVLTLNLLSETKEASNKVKFSNVESYLRELSNPKTLVFGNGVGSYFYSDGRREMVTHTELVYFDLLRGYGLFLTMFLLLIFIIPIVLMLEKKYDHGFLISYILYLLVAGTNPLLISSTGMIVLISAYLFSLKEPPLRDVNNSSKYESVRLHSHL